MNEQAIEELKADPAWPEFAAWALTLDSASNADLQRFVQGGECPDASPVWWQLDAALDAPSPSESVSAIAHKILAMLARADGLHPTGGDDDSPTDDQSAPEE